MQRVGLYGGSFDPIHLGHLAVARTVRDNIQLDQIIFLPTSSPPHKNAAVLASATHRRAMIQLAITDDPTFVCDDHDLARSKPTYTVETISHFRKTLGKACDLFWIIGWDSFLDLPSWRHLAQLVDSCQIITVARLDARSINWDTFKAQLTAKQIEKLKAGVLDTARVDVSSTDIRLTIRKGEAIDKMVPKTVGDYIRKHGLYGIA